MSLFTESMIVYAGNPKQSTKNLPEKVSFARLQNTRSI